MEGLQTSCTDLSRALLDPAEAEVLLKQATERAAGPDLAAATPAKQLVPAQPSVSEAPADVSRFPGPVFPLSVLVYEWA